MSNVIRCTKQHTTGQVKIYEIPLHLGWNKVHQIPGVHRKRPKELRVFCKALESHINYPGLSGIQIKFCESVRRGRMQQGCWAGGLFPVWGVWWFDLTRMPGNCLTGGTWRNHGAQALMCHFWWPSWSSLEVAGALLWRGKTEFSRRASPWEQFQQTWTWLSAGACNHSGHAGGINLPSPFTLPSSTWPWAVFSGNTIIHEPLPLQGREYIHFHLPLHPQGDGDKLAQGGEALWGQTLIACCFCIRMSPRAGATCIIEPGDGKWVIFHQHLIPISAPGSD